MVDVAGGAERQRHAGISLTCRASSRWRPRSRASRSCRPSRGGSSTTTSRARGARDVLELGTAHGVGAAYLAASGGAHVTTVDFAGAAYDPSPEESLARAGAADRVDDRARVLLVHVVAEGAGRRRARTRTATSSRAYDFVYLDGAKNWTIDGLAVILVEKLLRPGGWLLLDDLDWTYAQDPGPRGDRRDRAPRAVRARAHAAAPARRVRADRRPAPVVHGAARCRTSGGAGRARRRASRAATRWRPRARSAPWWPDAARKAIRRVRRRLA